MIYLEPKMTESIGYIGSALVAASLTMSNIRRLRWTNLLGAVFFVLYGVAVGAVPVIVVNAFIVLIDAYHLAKMARAKDFFSLMPMASTRETFLRGFLDFHKADIEGLFPGFDIAALKDARCVFLLRNMLPVGLFIYETVRPEGRVRIYLDYVIPEYRDLKNAEFLYESQTEHFRQRGFQTFEVQAESPVFESYLKKMGFKKGSEPQSYRRPI